MDRPDIATELAKRPDFRLGAAIVSPATRTVSGAGGTATIEPRVMQVLLSLADADGAVVTRSELIRRCWGAYIVSEDSLNRAIAEVRRIARTVAGAAFAIETIPKTGYRLTGARLELAVEQPRVDTGGMSTADVPQNLSRRRVLAVGGLAVASAAGVAIWRLPQDDAATRADALVARARLSLRDQLPRGTATGIALLREAVAIDPGSAAAWGTLALAWRAGAEFAAPGETASAVLACETAAAEALRLDPRQADAQAALAMLVPTFGDWGGTMQRLRAVLAIDAGNLAALGALSVLLMETGQTAASGRLKAVLAAREPLSPVFQYRQVYGLWCSERIDEARRLADRALQLWPQHPGVWLARLYTLAFTGRANAAVAMVQDRDIATSLLPELQLDAIRVSLAALLAPDRVKMATATAANVAAAGRSQTGAVNAVLMLSSLGQLDAAFDIASGYLLNAGPVIVPLRRPGDQPAINDQHRRKTMMLFVPVTSPMRADPRFLRLCEAMGMVAYWKAADITPDFLT